MAKFKKLVLLCTALMMTASVAAFAACGEEKKDSSPDTSASTPAEDGSSDDSSSEDSSSPEDNSSSEDTSSPDDGGGDETEPAVYYEEIVAGGNGSLTATAIGNVWGEITFSVEEAGLYGIYAVDANYQSVDVYFAPQGTTNSDVCMTNFIFNVEEAGDVTLATYRFAWGAETTNFSYYVYKLDTLTIEATTGVATLAANLRAPVTFVAPAAGEYVITSTQQLTWYNSADKSDDGTTSSSFLLSTEAAGEVDFYVMLDDLNYADFDFTWEVLTIEALTLQEGDNTVDLYAGVYREVLLTSETATTYTVTAASETYSFVVGVYGMTEWGLGWIEGNYENFFNVSVAAGETKAIHIFYSGNDVNWENGPANIETNVNVSRLVEADPSALAVGNNTFTATTDGVQATFTAEVAGTYAIREDNGSLWFEDTVDYGDYSKEVTLAAGESVTFTVKYEGLTTVAIEKLPDTIRLNLGENTVNVPAGESNLAIEADGSEFVLTWNNDNVIVYANGEAYVAGSLLDYSPYWGSYSVTTADGSAVENVVFTLAAFEYPTVELGDNTVTASAAAGNVYKFTATDPGCYTFTLTGDKITNVALNASDPLDYPDALSAAGAISINVKANAEIELYVEVSEDSEIGVNVAMTSTMNYLESSVTMDETGMNPVSLTIPSLPNGGVAYYVATKMTGDYTISWDSSYDLVVYAGEEVSMEYTDYQVRLTRTMMDGPIYLIVRNSNYEGANYENVVLNFAVYEEPPAEAQGQLVNLNEETTIAIESWGSTVFSFIAPADGEYTLTTASSVLVDLWVEGNWGYDRAWANVIDSKTGGSYTFTLTEGQIIDFFAMEYDMGEVSFVFTITAAAAEPEKFIVEGQAYYLRAVDYENSYIQSVSENGKYLVVGASPALTVSFELVEGTTNEYYIKLSSGQYVNSASSGNSLKFGDTAVDAWIIDEAAKTVQLKSDSNYYLQYNANANQERISRYKNTQHAVWFEVAEESAEPVEDKVDITIDTTNNLTIGTGYYLTSSATLNGEYTFDWNVFVSDETTEDVNDTVAVEDTFITVLVNDVEITSGAKLTYTEDTVVTIVIKSSDNTQNVYVSLTVTKTPEQVQPDNEWTNNY
ncbi:MAG: hypothetical protein IJX30_00450 [Clostridia bacterium]|nr:hypothetical protein [Clostridia bacterium]